MSWRRFQVLVRCLSPNSSTVAKLTAGDYIGSKRAAEVQGAANVDHWLEVTFRK